jgi:MFS family permease
MKVGLLKQKDFLLLMMGKLISLVGTQVQDFALSLYVFKKTGSAALFASVIAISIIPQILLAPIAGVFADWLDRKKIIVYLDLLSFAVVSSFAIVYFYTGRLSLTNIYVFVILLTIISALYQPAIGTVIPTIMQKDDLVDANGINTLIMNIGSLIVPGVAAMLFGIYGLFVILLVNAISFVIASIGEVFITIPKTNKMPEKISFKAFKTDFLEGVKFIIDKKIIVTIIALAPIINFVFSALFSVGIIFIAKKILKVSDFQYSMVQEFGLAAMMIAPFAASQYVKKHSLNKILYSNVLISTLLTAIMAIIITPFFLNLFNSNLIPYISLNAVVFFIVFFMTIINIALSALFQKIVPLPMMGRVSTVMNTCCMCSIPLGQLVFGFLFDCISAWICVLICSLIIFPAILCFKKSLLGYEEKAYEITSSGEIQISE